MEEQENFDFNDPPLARAGDPVTSHIAADKLKESGKWRGQKGRVLTWMRENRNEGDLTASEMAKKSTIPHPTCHKRLPDLEADGWVVKSGKRICKVTGELCCTWRLTTPEERAEVLATIVPRPARKARQETVIDVEVEVLSA